jgi:hypothetical protein
MVGLEKNNKGKYIKVSTVTGTVYIYPPKYMGDWK